MPRTAPVHILLESHSWRKLNIRSLEYRRLKNDITMVYKIIHKLVDLPFDRMFEFYKSPYETRRHKYHLKQYHLTTTWRTNTHLPTELPGYGTIFPLNWCQLALFSRSKGGYNHSIWQLFTRLRTSINFVCFIHVVSSFSFLLARFLYLKLPWYIVFVVLMYLLTCSLLLVFVCVLLLFFLFFFFVTALPVGAYGPITVSLSIIT